WCHVMEEESFMDTAVARIMNRHFVSIKIDREERPDLDQIYVNAAQLILGNAGWPLNAFALPDGKPFYISTYAPKEQWTASLLQVALADENDRSAIARRAQLVTEGVNTYFNIIAPVAGETVDQKSCRAIYDGWERFFDPKSGGLNGSPKFPMPVIWESMLQHHYLTGDTHALNATTTTLDRMARGGIFDQIAGGFARYSTDSEWKIPHFEKMLYDNGQLVSLYAHGFQVTGDSSYETVIRKTLNFVGAEMMSPEGGFYSSLNADSDGEEGKFYVWTKKEIEDILDEKLAPLFIAYYNIGDSGNWVNGKNVLHRSTDDEQFARVHALTAGQWRMMLIKAEETLLNVRNKRIHPSKDEKILTAWNALMLNGYIDAYFATGENSYLDIAIRNAGFLEKKMIRPDGRLFRSYIAGNASIDGFLDDHAFLAIAYIHLYEATFDTHWLDLAKKIADYAIDHFRDDTTGLFFYTSSEAENLVARTMETIDNVMPSSNSAFVSVLFRLAEYLDQASYQKIAEEALLQISVQKISESPNYASWAKLRSFVAFKPYELAVMGAEAVSKSREIYNHYLPTTLLMGGDRENLPLLESKLVKGQTTIYVCRDKICKLPTQDVAVALQQLGSMTPGDAK
ncbi:MAG TPA: thioredoxin domain-containing protein, partial [Cyclobacteriaceae bacterium]|nr:thioredoxin domain-containing protein [Cyclobacteriaceae bacterium]